jgi:hypothetical protein
MRRFVYIYDEQIAGPITVVGDVEATLEGGQGVSLRTVSLGNR